MEVTDRKECPKCHSKDVLETRSGIGSDKGGGSYTFNPMSEIICECKECHEKFFYKIPSQ